MTQAAIAQCGDGRHVFSVSDSAMWGGVGCQCSGEYLTYVTRKATPEARRSVVELMVEEGASPEPPEVEA